LFHIPGEEKRVQLLHLSPHTNQLIIVPALGAEMVKINSMGIFEKGGKVALPRGGGFTRND